MKYCSGCKETKDFSDFNRKGQGYQGKFRICTRLSYKKYYYSNPKERERLVARNATTREVVREHIRNAKNKPCTDCNVQYPYYVMQFDHIGEDKEHTIARLVNYTNLAMIDAEIAKCEVVCANCHAIRTWQRNQL
jgi:hypothetical protein